MKTRSIPLRIKNGDTKTNFKMMVEAIEEAKRDNIELLVFPEMALSGHMVGDRLHYGGFFCELLNYNDKLIELSEGLVLIWGNITIYESKLVKVGFVAENGKLLRSVNGDLYFVAVTRNENIFEDEAYIVSGKKDKFRGLFKTSNNEMILLTVGNCWAIDNILDDYEPADIIFVSIINEPYRYKQNEQIRDILKDRQIFKDVIYCNRSGIENNGKCFLVYDGKGAQELLNDKATPIEELLDVLIDALQEFDRLILGSKAKWIIGLSGGLDSSINAALLHLALGNKRIVGYSLPSAFNSTTTKNNAKLLARELQIEFHEVAIGSLAETTIKLMEENSDIPISAFNKENIQARIRGNLLMNFAAHNGGVVINNGNKVESALGYYTLYGDSIGAFSPLADLLNIELFELATAINQRYGRVIIPENLIPKNIGYSFEFVTAPSAELTDGQKDPMKWGYHDLLIEDLLKYRLTDIYPLLRAYKENRWQYIELGKWCEKAIASNREFAEDFRFILTNISRSIFKRIQGAPILSLSDSTIGLYHKENQGGLIFTDAEEKLLNEIENS